MRKNIAKVLLIFFMLVSACSSSVNTQPSPSTEIPTTTFTPEPTHTPTVVPTATPVPVGGIARQHYEMLAVQIGNREVNSLQETLAANYIQSVLKSVGYTPILQPFSNVVEKNGQEIFINSANVIAVKEGVSKQEIIVGAHYDSVIAGKGADDNASGVAVLLEVAQMIADEETPYTIRFITFGSEELEGQGSWYYATEFMEKEDIENTIAMLNIDSIAAGDFAYVYGDQGAQGVIRDWSLAWAEQNGFDLITQPGANEDYPAGTTGDWGDHFAFKYVGIPYTAFESTNWNLGKKDGFIQVDETLGEEGKIIHTQYDDVTYIDETFPNRADEHFRLYVTLIHAILTEFAAP